MKEEGLSDFMKLAYELGRVRDVEEAFEEFPPENEWHEGRIENVLKDKSIMYNRYFVGDIVFVKKYFDQNGEEGKNHLFVIIDQDNFAVPIENFGMLISYKLDKSKYKLNKLLEKDDKNGLDKDRIVKTDVIYKIYSHQILFKIGSVDAEKIREYKECYINK